MTRRLLSLAAAAVLVLALAPAALAQAGDPLRTPLPAPVKVKQGMLNVPALSPLWLLPEFAAKHNIQIETVMFQRFADARTALASGDLDLTAFGPQDISLAVGQGAVGGGSQIEGNQQQSGVGLASIPRDRFAGITTVERSAQPTLKKPLEHIGQVTLKPRDLSGIRSIAVNADASEGDIRLELLDADGYRMPGFTRGDSAVLTGDSLRHVAKWKRAELSALPVGEYSLRLHLHKATVYAVTFE